MGIKFCIFDVGKVCYDYTLDPLNDYCRRMSNDKNAFDKIGGVKSFDYDPYMKGEVTFCDMCMDLCRHCQVDFGADTLQIFDELMHQGIGSVFKETIAVMRFLKNNGVKICLLSNALPNLSGSESFLAYVDYIFLSYRLGLLKPDIRIFERVLSELGACPQEVAFVDDKQKNVDTAASLGIKAFVFDRRTIIENVKELF